MTIAFMIIEKLNLPKHRPNLEDKNKKNKQEGKEALNCSTELYLVKQKL